MRGIRGFHGPQPQRPRRGRAGIQCQILGGSNGLHETLPALPPAPSLSASAAFAQGYPERSITMVVPFAAGGPTDTVGRLIAEKMSADLGQQIIVENVGGAGGTLGAGQVAAAEADGYTILLHHIGMATCATLYRNLAYKPLEAFEYVGLVTEVPMTIVARKDFEPADMASLITYVKENADTIAIRNLTRCAAGGRRSIAHPRGGVRTARCGRRPAYPHPCCRKAVARGRGGTARRRARPRRTLTAPGRGA